MKDHEGVSWEGGVHGGGREGGHGALGLENQIYGGDVTTVNTAL